MKNQIFFLTMIIFFLFISTSFSANEYNASLAQMPIYAVSKTEGVLVDLVKEIEKISKNDIIINVYPFARSMYNVINKKADFHIPFIENNEISKEKLPFYYSDETIFHVNFVLYSKKGSNVTLDNLSSLKIETDRAHIDYFPFKVMPSNKIKESLISIHRGSIDGYIFADTATDPILKKLNYSDIQRRLYRCFDVKIILQKNEYGKELDKMLSGSIRKLKQNGKLKEILGSVDKPYDNWQP